jgi:hypothetical protein
MTTGVEAAARLAGLAQAVRAALGDDASFSSAVLADEQAGASCG